MSAVRAGSNKRKSWYKLHSAALMRARASVLEKVDGVIAGQSGRRSRSSKRRFVKNRACEGGPGDTRGVDLVRLCIGPLGVVAEVLAVDRGRSIVGASKFGLIWLFVCRVPEVLRASCFTKKEDCSNYCISHAKGSVFLHM